MNLKSLEAFGKQQEFMEAAQSNWLVGKTDAAKQYAREVLFYGNRALELAEDDEPFLSGIYMNMASAKYALYLYSDDNDLDYVREAASFTDKALEVKPNNQVALAFGALIYVLLGDFGRAAEMVEQLTVEGLSQHMQVVFDDLLKNIIPASVPPEKRKDSLDDLNRLFTALETKIKDLPMDDSAKDVLISSVLMYQAQYYYVKVGDVYKAYSIMDRALKDRSEESVYVSSYRVMATVCLDLRLDKREEALKYSELAYQFMDPEADDQSKADTLSAYGLALCRNEDGTGLEKCREAATIWPSDATYYNFARALCEMKQYEEALPWAWKAELLYADDEMNALLLGDIYRGLKDRDKSVEYYVKAYHKLQNAEGLLEYCHTEPTGRVIVSFTAPESLTFFLRYALKGIIRSYIGNDQQKAYAYLCAAEELFPDDESFDLMKDALAAIDVSREEVEQLKQELSVVKDESEKQRKMSAALVKKLIKIQDESQSLDLDDADDWETFSEKIEGVIQSLEAQAAKEKKLMQNIKERIVKQYPFLKENAIKFLTTAETLYEIHKGTEIDYACIIIEYVKVCEYQLRDRLSSVLSPDDKMLGNIIYVISNKGVTPYNRYMGPLNKINSLRKRSAHTGLLSQSDVESLKKIYFDDGFLLVLK